VNKDGLQYISGDNIGYKIPESLRLTFNYIISANTYFALKSMQNQWIDQMKTFLFFILEYFN